MPASTLGLIVELLSFCVQHHQYRVKYYILRSDTVGKVQAADSQPHISVPTGVCQLFRVLLDAHLQDAHAFQWSAAVLLTSNEIISMVRSSSFDFNPNH